MIVNLKDFKTIFFLHIPKTGGNSIYAHLNEFFPDRKQLKTTHNENFLDNIENIVQSDLISGHQFYPFTGILKKPVFIFTFLRKPYERVISAYEYILRNSQNPYHVELISNGYSIQEFIRDKKLWYHAQNMQTRMLGLDFDYTNIINQLNENNVSIHFAKKEIRKALEEPCTKDTLKCAIERLDSMNFFGITEYFDESARQFFKLTGVKHSTSIPINKLNAAPDNEAILRNIKYSEDDIKEINKYNGYDNALYDYASEIFLNKYKNNF